MNKSLQSPSPPSGEPGAPLLETERLLLRRYTMADAPALAAAGNHPAITAGLRDRFPSPYTLADAEAFLGQQMTPVENFYPVHCGLWVKPGTEGNPSDEPLYIGAMGTIASGDIYYRTWELGYWLTPSVWGKGYMTEAVRGFTRWAFETWPRLVRIEAMVFESNAASASTLKKCGFVHEGIRRRAIEKRGVVQDEAIFSLLRTDLGLAEE